MNKTLAMSALALSLAAGCTTQKTPTSPNLAPATEPAPPKKSGPNFIERTADATWQTLKKPVELIIPAKTAATEPATQPVPTSAQAIILIPGHNDPSVSPMRIPVPPDENEK